MKAFGAYLMWTAELLFELSQLIVPAIALLTSVTSSFQEGAGPTGTMHGDVAVPAVQTVDEQAFDGALGEGSQPYPKARGA
jgi:hypothetical protein